MITIIANVRSAGRSKSIGRKNGSISPENSSSEISGTPRTNSMNSTDAVLITGSSDWRPSASRMPNGMPSAIPTTAVNSVMWRPPQSSHPNPSKGITTSIAYTAPATANGIAHFRSLPAVVVGASRWPISLTAQKKATNPSVTPPSLEVPASTSIDVIASTEPMNTARRRIAPGMRQPSSRLAITSTNAAAMPM